MALGLILDDDVRVNAWVTQAFRLAPMKMDRVVGLVDPTGHLVGAILLHNYNGVNVELGYYGPKTVSLGIVRAIARIVLIEFNAARCTMLVSKKRKRLINSLQKIG